MQRGGQAPDFIGLGAQKCATSWIYACLEEHPAICMPVKELHFFSREVRYQRGSGWYEQQFARCSPGRIAGEFSTSYLESPRALQRIAQDYPAAKVLISLRNPIERARSNYYNDLMAGVVAPDVPFRLAARQHPEYLSRGRYGAQIAMVRDLFDASRVCIVLVDDIEHDPIRVMRDMYGFLGVDDGFCPTALSRRINESRIPASHRVERGLNRLADALRAVGLTSVVNALRRQGVTTTVRGLVSQRVNPEASKSSDPRELWTFFKDDVTFLEELLGRDLSSWRP